MLQVVNMKHNPLGEKAAGDYVKVALEKNNYDFSLNYTTKESLDNFYFLIDNNEIVGCCGLTFDEIILGKETSPWITSLHLNQDYRGHNYGQLLINHVIQKVELLGYDTAYVRTEEKEFYRSQNWTELEGYYAKMRTDQVFYKKLDERL